MLGKPIAYTRELPGPPTEVLAEEWQRAVSQIDREVKPTLVTLQTSLGGYELKLKDLSGRVSPLEGTLSERLKPLKQTLEELDLRYSPSRTRWKASPSCSPRSP